MEFPRWVHKADGAQLRVENEAEYQDAKKAGWLLSPPASTTERSSPVTPASASTAPKV